MFKGYCLRSPRGAQAQHHRTGDLHGALGMAQRVIGVWIQKSLLGDDLVLEGAIERLEGYITTY